MNIYVPENATGYDKKPWSDQNIIRDTYIKATEIRPAETDVVLDLNGSSYKDVYYSVLPSNATTKSIYIKNSNESVASAYSYKNDAGTYISISGRKQGTTTITLITNDGFVSETIDVTVIKGSVKPDDDDDPTTKTDHTVIFKNDGTVYETQNVTDGGKVRKPADPAKSGYTFIGWANGNSLWNFTTPVTYDLVLIAKYAKETVSDNQSSGSGLDPKPEITEDKKIYLVVAEPV